MNTVQQLDFYQIKVFLKRLNLITRFYEIVSVNWPISMLESG